METSGKFIKCQYCNDGCVPPLDTTCNYCFGTGKIFVQHIPNTFFTITQTSQIDPPIHKNQADYNTAKEASWRVMFMTLADAMCYAQSKSLCLRIASNDDVPCIIPAGLKFDRLNVHLHKGTVTGCDVG